MARKIPRIDLLFRGKWRKILRLLKAEALVAFSLDWTAPSRKGKGGGVEGASDLREKLIETSPVAAVVRNTFRFVRQNRMVFTFPVRRFRLGKNSALYCLPRLNAWMILGIFCFFALDYRIVQPVKSGCVFLHAHLFTALWRRFQPKPHSSYTHERFRRTRYSPCSRVLNRERG